LPVASLKDSARVARAGFAQRLVASVGNQHQLEQLPAKLRQDRFFEIVFAGSLQDAMRLSLTKKVVKGFEMPS
jgi:hypothetical protein